MISSRYLWAALVLFLLALIPTALNFYQGLPVAEPGFTSALPVELAQMRSEATTRDKDRIREIFRTDDWLERTYASPSGSGLTLFLARGFDGKIFFHYPEYGLLRRNWSTRVHKVESMRDGAQSIMVHELTLSGQQSATRVLYVLLYGKESLGNPYLDTVRFIPRMLLGERESYFLLFVHDGGIRETSASQGAMESLLLAAVDHILSHYASRKEGGQ